MPDASPTPGPPTLDPRVSAVMAWFDRHARDLPWRDDDRTAWGVLVSEVMLQQTPVVRVLPVWHEWMERWPTPAALAADAPADAVRAWGRLGYPRRARRLWECAVAIQERHEGQVPADAEDLRALPGIGDYTAAAVMAFAFGRRSVVLDTNVRRVIGRAWDGVPLPSAHLTRSERMRAEQIVPPHADAAVAWSAAAMELGALVCTSRAPRCGECPVSAACAWLNAGAPGLAEAPRRTQAWAGTDRQVRGRIVALLREEDGAVVVAGHTALADVEPGQLDRCLDSLEVDGLITPVAPGSAAYVL